MIRSFIILICICSTACCAVVAYLSMQVEKEVELVGESESYTCRALLDEKPQQTMGIKLSEFVTGKFNANFDLDNDGKWDEVCLPLFPPNKKKFTYGYKAVLVKFNNVTSQEELDKLVASGKLDTNYWPRRQDLDKATYSSLAQSYMNLDISDSVVVHCGYRAENPLLGESSLQLSKLVGAASLGIAFLTLLTFLFKKRAPKDLRDLDLDGPVTNRAGLPIS